MRKNLFIIFCWSALISGATLSFAQPKTQTANTEDLQKQKKAEQIVIRAVRRFGQTLDFSDVYRKDFISNEKVKQKEMNLLIDMFVEEKVQQKIRPAVLKNGFIKANKIIWLFCLVLDDDGWFENLEKNFIPKLNKQQYELYQRVNKSEDEKYILKSKTDVLNALTMGDITDKMFSSRITPKLRQDLQNKTTIDDSRLIDSPNNKPYLFKYKSFYKITIKVNDRWVPFVFTVVEESGEMKIFSASIYFD